MYSLSVWQAVIGTLLAAIVLPFILYPDQTLQTLRKKRYQYEVTFGLYMLTPTEKFILNSIFFLIISMVTLATVIYLPSHIRYFAKRLFYYVSGQFHYPSFSSVSEGVSSMQSRLQASLNEASAESLYQVSQNMAEGASDMAKGMVAAAAGQLGAVTSGSAPGAMAQEAKVPSDPGSSATSVKV